MKGFPQDEDALLVVRSMPHVDVLSTSGGKDSTAMILRAREAGNPFRCVFADTGNECDVTMEYLDYLEAALGIRIERYRADFTGAIWHRRRFVSQDSRPGDVRHTRDAKRRALRVLRPSGIPFLDLCLVKGLFPSRKAQFCTERLKRNVIHDEVYLPLHDQGKIMVSWQGIRRDESAQRANAQLAEFETETLCVYRPLVDLTTEDVFALHRRHGIKPNPLYTLGFRRVGCMPCINAGKDEIQAMVRCFPGEIGKIREWEYLVGQASKRGDATFFPAPTLPPAWGGGHTRASIDNVVSWSRTVRGGRQFSLMAELEPAECRSLYGLCE